MIKPFAIREMNQIISLESAHFSIHEAGWSYHQHEHKGYELLYCYRGQVIEWIHGESIEFTSGSWLLITPGVKHSSSNHAKDDFCYLSIHFGLEDVEFRNQLKHLNYLFIEVPPEKLNSLFNELVNLMDGSMEVSVSFLQKLSFQSLLLQILSEVLSFSPDYKSGYSEQKRLDRSEIELAQKIENFIVDALYSTITVQEIADQLFMSRSHCNVTFKKVYGISPRQYMSMLKLKKTKDLILHSDLSIEKISETLGFSCVNSFSRQFRRWTKVSPSAYKQMAGGHRES